MEKLRVEEKQLQTAMIARQERLERIKILLIFIL